MTGLYFGILLFIISELFAFLSIFWAYFHSALSPAIELGSVWPPLGLNTINSFSIPLLNTILLLSSGATITYAHHALLGSNRKGVIIGTALTIFFATIFSLLQYVEYTESPFTIADSVYGSAFFCSTGLHAIHVLVGTIFITVGFFRILSYHFTSSHHTGLESAIYYWHMVDVVWLFLFIFVYVWGSGDLTTEYITSLDNLNMTSVLSNN